MSRVFLMKWYHFTVEYFEDLRNVDHCEFLIMRKQDNGKYLLENKLRTWSELRRERGVAVKNGGSAVGLAKDEVKIERNKTFVVTRRWGGCPDGCNHTNHYKKRHDLEALRQRDLERSAQGAVGASSSSSALTIATRRMHHRQQQAISSDGDDEQSDYPLVAAATSTAAAAAEVEGARTLDEVLSSPDGTPSFVSAEIRLRSVKPPHVHVGRDFGGSYSGHASLADSDSDASAGQAPRRHRFAPANGRPARAANDNGPRAERAERAGDAKDSRAGPRVPAFANRLGDAPPAVDAGPSSTDGSSVDDMDRIEVEERSIRESVY